MYVLSVGRGLRPYNGSRGFRAVQAREKIGKYWTSDCEFVITVEAFIFSNVLKDITDFIFGIKSASCRVKGAIYDQFHAVRSQPDAVPVTKFHITTYLLREYKF